MRLPTCPSCQSVTGLRTLSCPSCDEGLLLEPGTLVEGRYEIEHHLGKGGMGTVFRARDRDLEQNVAIKFLRTSRHPEAAARFKAEIRLARKVKHPNVCAIWQNGYLDGVAYFVMELVEGRTLRDLVREQGPLAAAEACHLTLEAASGLRAIHEAGVIHRDVKSPNLMLDTRGVVRVVDFGIAKRDPTRPGPDLTLDPRTATNQIVGSPEYMSPEQVRGLPLDARTDIYSLGVVLYELCVGRVPFRGTSAFDMMMMHVQTEPVLEGPAVDGVALALLPILRRALAKARDDRYPTMRAFMSDLARVQADSEERWTESYPRRRPQSRQRREGKALLLGLAVGAAALLLSELVRPGKEEPVPTSTTATASEARTPSSGPSEPSPVPRDESKPAPRLDKSIVPPVEAPSRGNRSTEFRNGRDRNPGPANPGEAFSRPTEPSPSFVIDPKRGPVVSPPESVVPRPDAKSEPTSLGETPTTTVPTPPLPPLNPSAGGAKEVAPVCTVGPVDYPPALVAAGIEGTVDVEVLVNEQGRASKPRALGSAHSKLKEEAIKSVASWSCRPATRAGVPIPMPLIVPVAFRLSDRRR